MIDKNQIKKYLEKICASDDFNSSETNIKLLTYLVNNSLEHNIPTETDIAIDVFNKDATFNSSTDSIVRSHIYLLRTKLEKYYLTAGSNDTITISIPKGRYEAVFTHVPQKKKRTILNNPYFLISYSVLILLLVYSIIMTSSFLNLQQKTGKELPSFPWKDFENSTKTTSIILGDFFVFVEKDTFGVSAHRRVRKGSVNSMKELIEYYKNAPEREKNFTGMTHTYLNTYFLPSLATLVPRFVKSEIPFKLDVSSRMPADEPEEKNIIYLGIFKTMGNLDEYFKKSSFETRHYPHQISIGVPFDSTFFDSYKVGLNRNFRYNKAYTAVVKVPGPNNNTILFVAGHAMTGINSIVNTMVTPNFEKMVKNYDKSITRLPKYFQALFENDIVGQKSGDTLLHFSKIDTTQNIDEK